MNNTPLLLGLDVGTTNCKALLFDLHGQPVAGSSVPTPTTHPRPNWAEHDPAALWDAVVLAIRQALAGRDPARVQGVAVASMGEAGVLLDGRGQPTGPIIAWYDSRSLPQYTRWMAQGVADASFRIAGIKPDPIYGVYKLMWLREHAPEAYRAAAHWLHVADYIAFRLCGVPACDYSLASRSMLLDLQRRCWSDTLAGWGDVRRDLLPELVPSGSALGGVTAEAAAATGLLAGTPVGAGGHDHVCGAFAAGVREGGACLDSMGTAEAVFLTLDALTLDDALAASGCTFGAHVAQNKFYTMDGLWSSGAAVAWARDALAWPGAPPTFEQMEATAAQVPPGSHGVFFLPRLAGGERGAFVGLTGASTPAMLGRAVYEGLAYEWRRCLEGIEAALKLPVATIRLIGGGTRSALWVQTKADVLGRPLHVLEVDEGVALGAALLAGRAAGVYAHEAEALSALHSSARRVAPDPERAALYEQRYREVYLAIAPALAQVHRTIAGLP